MELYRNLSDLLQLLYYGVDRDIEPINDFDEYFARPEIIDEMYLFLGRLDLLRRSQWEPRNSGKRWSSEEDLQLLSTYEEGASINSLAAIHKRTEVAIVKRLNKLGKNVWDSYGHKYGSFVNY